MDTAKRQKLALGLVALIGVGTSILMFWMLAKGPGVSPDSVAYIETARGLLAGEGFYADGQPMTRYAPGYPLLLALFGISQQGDVLLGSRLLSAILFGLNAALFGLTIFICTKRNLSAAGMALGFFLALAPNVSTHSMAWSEAPFLTFSLAAFILLSLYIARPSIYLLLAAVLCASGALTTRYIGVTLLPPMVTALLFFGMRPRKRKITDSLLAAALALLPLAAWIVRNLITTGTAASRSFVVHRIGLYQARQFLTTMANFIFPVSKSGWLEGLQMETMLAVQLIPYGLFGVLILFTLAFLSRKKALKCYLDTASGSLTSLWLLFLVSYLIFLAISESTFDASTPLDERILLPAFLAITIVFISLIFYLAAALDKRLVWYGFILFMLILIFNNSTEALGVIKDMHKNGSGYTSVEWKNSKTIAAAALLPKELKIYSNGYDVIPFLTGRTVSMLPAVANLETSTAAQDYDHQLQGMCKEVEEGVAAVVYLNSIGWRGFLPSLEELDEKCTMPVLGRFVDGVIYGR
jgi:4-amino-4-deoxy-L-arabinose transferase-like glycosyltransferase